MYQLKVFYAGAASPGHVESTRSASDVMTLLPRLLQDHPDCHHIQVFSDQTHLFTVDCHGNRVS